VDETIGGLRNTRYCGRAKTRTSAYLVAAAYNLLRIGRILSFEEARA
jgi:hypothetical protein